MCIEDIRLGRKKRTTAKTVVAANGVSSPLVGFSKNRTHILIDTGSGTAHFAPQGIDPTGNGALHLAPSHNPIELDIETHGQIVTSVWNCAGIGADVTCIVIETFLDEQ